MTPVKKMIQIDKNYLLNSQNKHFLHMLNLKA